MCECIQHGTSTTLELREKREQETRQTALGEYSLLPKRIAVQYTKTPAQSGLGFNT